MHKIYLVLNNYCSDCTPARPEFCLCLWCILQHGAAHTAVLCSSHCHLDTLLLFCASCIAYFLRNVPFWVVMQWVVVRSYHYFLCYNPEEFNSQLLLSRSLKSFTLPCCILYILGCRNTDWQVCLCQTWRILFMWLAAALPWCTCQSWMICGNDSFCDTCMNYKAFIFSPSSRCRPYRVFTKEWCGFKN